MGNGTKGPPDTSLDLQGTRTDIKSILIPILLIVIILIMLLELVLMLWCPHRDHVETRVFAQRRPWPPQRPTSRKEEEEKKDGQEVVRRQIINGLVVIAGIW